jgi:hypothetical protein
MTYKWNIVMLHSGVTYNVATLYSVWQLPVHVHRFAACWMQQQRQLPHPVTNTALQSSCTKSNSLPLMVCDWVSRQDVTCHQHACQAGVMQQASSAAAALDSSTIAP